MLSVLSGEKPVTDAITEAGISRQLYYQLEEKALQGPWLGREQLGEEIVLQRRLSAREDS